MYSDILGVEWDDGNWPKCGKHGVSKKEIESLLTAASLIVFPDPHGGEERLRSIGQTDTGRHIFIVWTIRLSEGGKWIRPISARFMHKDEVDDYET